MSATAAVCAACIVATAALTVREDHRARDADAARLAAAADDVAATLASRLRDYALILSGLRGFAHAGGGVDRLRRDAWRQYARDLRAHDPFGGIKGLALVRRARTADLPALAEAARDEYLPDFAVHPAPDPDGDAEHRVIVYHEPLAPNRRAVGFDIATNQSSVAAQDAARDSGQVTLTGATRLVQQRADSPARVGLVMYAAIYDGNAVPGDRAARRERQSGLVGAPIFADELIAPAVGRGLRRDVRVVVRDAGETLWDSDPGDARTTGLAAGRAVEFGGRRWSLALEARPSFRGEGAATQTATAGLLGTTLLTAVTWGLAASLRRTGRRAASVEARFAAAFHGGAAGMGLLDGAGRWTAANDALCRMLGRPRDGVVSGALTLADAVHPDDRPAHDAAAARLLRPGVVAGEGRRATFECRLRRPDGREIWAMLALAAVPDPAGRDGRPGLVLQAQDLTDRKRLERRLERAATHDRLTRLPTRAVFDRALADRFAGRVRGHYDPRFAVLFVDLDRFKAVNDDLGHAAGDRLLRGVAGRLRAQLRRRGHGRGTGDLAARLGGDEFVVILGDIASPQQALAVADRLRRAVAAPFRLGPAGEARVGASIGVATGFGHHETAADLLRRADAAMYAAKRRGRSGDGRPVLLDGDAPPARLPRAA